MNTSDSAIELKESKKQGFRAGYHTPGIIYCFYSPKAKLYKIGRTRERVERRLNLVNTTRIAEVGDWIQIIETTILSPEAGHSETRIAALLSQYNVHRPYGNKACTAYCRELYSCSIDIINEIFEIERKVLARNYTGEHKGVHKVRESLTLYRRSGLTSRNEIKAYI